MTARTINIFFESTCVIIVFAYLLTRGPMIALLGRERLSAAQTLVLGGVFGAAGLLELFFASERFPYDTYTLIVTFAALRAGRSVALIAAGVLAAGAALFQSDLMLLRTILSVLISVAAAGLVRRLLPAVSGGTRPTHAPGTIPAAMIAGSVAAIVLAEAGSILIHLMLARGITTAAQASFSPPIALMKIAANGFGIILLQMTLNDAQMRLDAERFRAEAEHSRIEAERSRAEAEHSRALLAEAHLAALRARVHPHFLFNTLTSIAALCRNAPRNAAAATTHLGQIMRRALDADTRSTVPLSDELEYVEEYIEIEKLRLGKRLSVVWNVDVACTALAHVPPFALQTLVENAILHGISSKFDPGTVTITVRGYPRHVLIAVTDDGIGMAPGERPILSPPSPPSGRDAGWRLHGLGIITEQLRLLYGALARPRLFSRVDVGTRVVFVVPLPSGMHTVKPLAGTETEQTSRYRREWQQQ